MSMRLLIDADGCPVVALAVSEAKARGIPCLILCDTAHEMEHPGAETVVVSKGVDSVDFALLRRLAPGDIVITQDYGLAALCLARRAWVLDQNGRAYTEENIDALLTFREAAGRIRRGGGRLKGASRRKRKQDTAFLKALRQMLDDVGKTEGNR